MIPNLLKADEHSPVHDDRAQPDPALPDAPESLPGPAAAEPDAAGVPEKFRDPETGALQAEKLLKSYLALEQRMARMVPLPDAGADDAARQRFHRALGVPATPEAYEISLTHPQVSIDPAVNARLHAAGFTPAQAQVVYDLACDHVMPQVETLVGEMQADREREKLCARFGGPQRFREVARSLAAWGEANLPPAVFTALASTAQGVLALETMMKSAEPGLQHAAAAADAPGQAELAQLMRDPRYWKHRDPEILDRVTQGFRRLYPG